MGPVVMQVQDELGAVMNARRGIGAPITPLSAAFGGSAIAFRSNFSPEVLVAPGASGEATPSSSGGTTAQAFLEQAQPTVEGVLPDGSRFTIFAPYGESRGDYRVYVAGILVAVTGSLLVAITLAYVLGRRTRRRSR